MTPRKPSLEETLATLTERALQPVTLLNATAELTPNGNGLRFELCLHGLHTDRALLTRAQVLQLANHLIQHWSVCADRDSLAEDVDTEDIATEDIATEDIATEAPDPP